MEIRNVQFKRNEKSEWEDGIMVSSSEYTIRSLRSVVIDMNAEVVESHTSLNSNSSIALLYKPEKRW